MASSPTGNVACRAGGIDRFWIVARMAAPITIALQKSATDRKNEGFFERTLSLSRDPEKS
jgi:hypothetical protein